MSITSIFFKAATTLARRKRQATETATTLARRKRQATETATTASTTFGPTTGYNTTIGPTTGYNTMHFELLLSKYKIFDVQTIIGEKHTRL